MSHFRGAVRVIDRGLLGHGDFFWLGDFRSDIQICECRDAEHDDGADYAQNPFEQKMLLASLLFRAVPLGTMSSASCVTGRCVTLCGAPCAACFVARQIAGTTRRCATSL
ncbi:hypothetical protein BITS_1408 [Bifidobacterium tsurumiense]|uniref:Uncharacterized protein n=1 Tax=Bifidobacterium tsurumiense TaxID=356829 RepID=A0A087E956_9BIFI|nr:hypothetical protein BITS_1408 [Bifidobacterium tsurumiense]